MTKEIVDHPGGVTIFPVTDHGTALLVRQWRQPVGDVLLEAPAGTLEPGEDPADCAHRELREEAGVRAGKLTSLGGSWVAPGYSTEFNWGFLASNLTEDPLQQDDSEDIHTVEVKIEDIPRMIREGELQDQMTIAAYLAAAHVFETEAA